MTSTEVNSSNAGVPTGTSASPLRILHVDSEKSWRGGQQQVFSLMQGLRERGHEQRLVTPLQSHLGVRAREAGFAVEEFDLIGWYDPRIFGIFKQIIANFQPTLVHAHSGNGQAIAHMTCRKSHPIVVTRRVDFAVKKNPLSRWRYRSPGTRYIAISNAVKNVLRDAGVPDDRITIVHSGVDPTRASGGIGTALRPAFLGDREGPVVGYVGAIVDHKNPLLLAEAARLIDRDLPGLRVIYIGAGPIQDSPEWSEKVRATPSLFYETGWRADIAEVFASLDMFVMPSVEEGLCTSLLDAQAAGVPCIVTAAGGMVEIVRDGINGLVVPSRDAKALSEAIMRLAGDDALRAKFRAAGPEVVRERFTLDAMVAGNEACYMKIRDEVETGRFQGIAPRVYEKPASDERTG